MVYQLSAMKRYSTALPSVLVGVLLAASASCSGASRSGPAVPIEGPNAPASASPPTTAAAGSAPTAAAPATAATGGTVVRPAKRLTIPEARRYMVQLVNRDRAKMGLALKPLETVRPDCEDGDQVLIGREGRCQQIESGGGFCILGGEEFLTLVDW